jgi:preprotein translocase subunit SecG
MVQILLAVHLVIALIIIILILLQQGKGAEAGASFGAGASQTMFGSAGSWNFFSRMTAIFANLFFVTSIALAVVAKREATASDPYLPELEQVEIPVEETPAEIPSAADEGGALEIPVLQEEASDEFQALDDAPATDIPEIPEEIEEMPSEELPEPVEGQ